MTPIQKELARNITAPTRKQSGQAGSLSLAAPRPFLTFSLLALLLSGLALLLGPTSHVRAATARDSADGHVYVLNNNLGGPNSITTFAREENGSLKLLGSTPIGGLGSLAAFADGTQGSLIITPNRTRLFAVDAGSNQVSVVNVERGKLSLQGVFSSGGSGPISLTYRDGLLYVLNAANASAQAANVTGFRVDDEGDLHPIPGAARSLSVSHPNPAQVQIDPSGRFLLITEKSTNRLDVYRIHSNGSLDAPTTFQATGNYPFGMAFDPARPREFIVADGFGGQNKTGAVTAYRLEDGSVHVVNGPVPDYLIAPCWMVVTHDGHYAYTSDADSHAISGYRIHANGEISLLNPNGVTGSTPADTFPLEEGLSHDSHFLYVLDSRLLNNPPGPATLSGFRIHENGSLTTVVDPGRITLPFTAIGLAAE